MRKTKIICTLGPATDNESVLRELMLAGMDVARLNFSHQTNAEQKVRIDMVKKLREELNLPVALLLDTKGPEIRTGNFSQKKVTLKEGQTFTLTTRDVEGDDKIVSITFPRLPQEVATGSKILIDDGLIELRVDSCTDTDIICTVVNGGDVSSHKGINVPGAHLSLPFISEKDKEDLAFGVEQGFDFIAASFTRTAQDILDLRAELEKHDCHNIRIIAKIENADGVDNIDEILRVSDGIMVARGDLGVEIPLQEIPVIQKKLIKKGYNAGLQVITATQMLDSMIRNPRPTRAEVADVANAIYDGTDAVTLSGETAIGMYPVPAVQTMARIAEASESHIYDEGSIPNRNAEQKSISAVVGLAAVTAAENVGACCIVTPTMTGRTARIVSNYRPKMPIYAVTTSEEYRRSLQLNWGVTPLLGKVVGDASYVLEQARSVVVKKNFVNKGDICVFTLGDRTTSPRIGQTGDAVSFDPTAPSPRPTNVMQIVQIGVEAEGDN